ncbi:MAG: hypothetical protein ACC657_05655 [Thiohalomonadales bacterium]
MKIMIKSNPITPYGSFHCGQEINDTVYPIAFLNHLIGIDAAVLVEHETKIDHDFEPIKKSPSTQSSPQEKASRKRTPRPRTKKVGS